MKQQNHRMSTKTDDPWPMEDIQEKMNIQPVSTHPAEIDKQIAVKARAKLGIASEHYHQAVAKLAYEFWGERGRPHGSPETDWLKAEAALKPLWAADLDFASMDSAPDNPRRDVALKLLLVVLMLNVLSGCWFHAGPVGGGIGKNHTPPTHAG